MRNHCLIRTIPRKDDAIRAGAAPAKRALIRQNRKLVVRPGVGERKAFPVVVLVRVVVTDGGALLQVVAGGGDGVVDVGLGVAG